MLNRYRLSSDQADRIRFDEAVQRFACECVAADLANDCAGLTLEIVAARQEEFLTPLGVDDQEEAVERFTLNFAPAYGAELMDRTAQTILVNLTPHAINIVDADGSALLTVAPSGTVARCATAREVVGSIVMDNAAISVNRTVFGAVQGVPDPAPDAYYIVSSLVAQALPDRQDLLIPDDTVRDAEGRIIGCRALARV